MVRWCTRPGTALSLLQSLCHQHLCWERTRNGAGCWGQSLSQPRAASGAEAFSTGLLLGLELFRTLGRVMDLEQKPAHTC